jgi:hypothetical protein
MKEGMQVTRRDHPDESRGRGITLPEKQFHSEIKDL